MDRNYKFRLYPSKAQETEMNTHRWMSYLERMLPRGDFEEKRGNLGNMGN